MKNHHVSWFVTSLPPAETTSHASAGGGGANLGGHLSDLRGLPLSPQVAGGQGRLRMVPSKSDTFEVGVSPRNPKLTGAKRREFLGMIHWLTINNNPNKPHS